MIPWWGMVVAFFGGVFFGWLIIALVSANDDNKE